MLIKVHQTSQLLFSVAIRRTDQLIDQFNDYFYKDTEGKVGKNFQWNFQTKIKMAAKLESGFLTQVSIVNIVIRNFK